MYNFYEFLKIVRMSIHFKAMNRLLYYSIDNFYNRGIFFFKFAEV